MNFPLTSYSKKSLFKILLLVVVVVVVVVVVFVVVVFIVVILFRSMSFVLFSVIFLSLSFILVKRGKTTQILSGQLMRDRKGVCKRVVNLTKGQKKGYHF